MFKHITQKKKIAVSLVVLFIVSFATGSYFNYDRGYAHGYIQGLAEAGGTPTVDGTVGVYNFPWLNATQGINAPEFYLNDELLSQWETASYIIFKDGSTFYAKNGATGLIDYSGSNETTVTQNALNDLTPSRTWKECLVIKGLIVYTGKIKIPSYTILNIQGTIKAADGLNSSFIANSDLINGNTDIEIYGGTIDGNKANQGSATDDKSTVDMSKVTNLMIHDISILNGWTAALRTEFCENVIISNNYFNNSADDAIAINEETCFATVTGNIIDNVGVDIYYGAPCGIEVQDGAHDVVISNNVVKRARAAMIQISTHSGKPAPYRIVVSSNELYCYDGMGIQAVGLSGYELKEIIITNNIATFAPQADPTFYLDYLDNSTVANNRIDGGQNGIYVDHSDYVKISGNYITNARLGGIIINSGCQKIVLDGNTVLDSGISVSGSQVGIQIYCDYGIFINNICMDTRTGGDKTQQYGFCLYAGADNNYISENILSDNAVKNLLDSGANNEIKRNEGFNSEKAGTTTLVNGQTSITVSHGCEYTPSAGDISVHPIEPLGSASYWYVDTITSTQFTIRVDVNPGQDVDFAWSVYRH